MVIEMTIEQWQQYGYIVVLHLGCVYLVRLELQVGYTALEENGKWLQHLNVNRLPWRFVDLRKHPDVLALAREQAAYKHCA